MCSTELRVWAGVDVTKHAVLGKFNEIRPGVYREYMKDVCEKVRNFDFRAHGPG